MMNAKKYFSIGSEAQNDLQLSEAFCAPFHLFLYRDSYDHIMVANRTAGANYHLNGQICTHTKKLHANDTLHIGSQQIDWMAIFEISEVEISAIEAQEESALQEQKGLRIQLVLIYVAIAALLFLMAFYI
jgi:hypothetical protein